MSRQTKYTIKEEEAFICGHCGAAVPPPEQGTHHRNHCPRCLWSRHVDMRTGDRRASCRGLMEPVGIWARGHRDWSLIHRCRGCGLMRANRIAGDDDETLLFYLAAKPLAELPFPTPAVPGMNTIKQTESTNDNR